MNPAPWLFLALSAAILCTVPATSGAQEISPIRTRADASAIHEEEDRIWAESKRAVSAFEKAGVVSRSHEEVNAYLARIIRRLTPTLAEVISIRLIQNPQPNAMMFPNGQGFISTGLIGIMSNEVHLAAVLAHEIAHFVERHGYVTRNQNNRIMGAGRFIGLGLPIFAELAALSSIYGYSRDREAQADALSYDNLRLSGYDPGPGAEILQRLADYAKDIDKPEPIFFASHPKSEARAAEWRSRASLDSSTKLDVQRPYEGDFLTITQTVRTQNLHDNLGVNRFKPIIRLLDNADTRADFDQRAFAPHAKALIRRGESNDITRAKTLLEGAFEHHKNEYDLTFALGEMEFKAKNFERASFYLAHAKTLSTEPHHKLTIEELQKWIKAETGN